MLKLVERLRAKPLDNRVGLSVGDMIAALEKCDPNAPVVIGGQYGGFVEVRSVGATGICLNVNSAEGFGPHDVPGPDDLPQIQAVLLVAASDQAG